MQRTHLSLIASALLSAGLAGCGGSSDSTPTTTTVAVVDADTVADQNAAALLSQMTLDEKIQLVHGAGFGSSPIGGAGFVAGIPRLGIPDIISADSSGGVNVDKTGATSLPSPLALAASWDTSLANQYGALIGKELRTLGFTEGLGGGVNLAREPRNGRTFEYLGEDPLLAGNMITQRIIGTQAQNVIATIKHFAVNDQETNRFTSNAIVDERTLRELSLLPFEIGVKNGAPGNVMCSYNLVNGVKACQNSYLLTDTLKNEWGFKGVVQSDWFMAVTDTVPAAIAGLDEEQPGSLDDSVPGFGGLKSHFNQSLKAAIQSGQVPQSRLDDMVLRKLRTLYKLGIMASPPKAGGTIDRTAGNALAQQVAEQSMVLLKNAAPAGTSTTALPLNAASIKSIAVIGGHADVAVLAGGGSGGSPAQDGNPVTCLDTSILVEGIFSACATWYKSSPLAAIQAKAPNATVTYLDGTDATAAATAAATADVTIVFATQWESEGMDLASLSLPNHTTDPSNQAYDQDALISAVAAKAKRTVVVLETGTAVTMPWLANVHAVLESWYPGIQGGPAIANLLFGTVNPSGKLPLSFPVADSDLPQKTIAPTDVNVVYNEGLMMGYRWYDAHQIAPLFPFGHGLSYTTFAYSGMSSATDAAGNVTVSFTLTNNGSRAGAEVAQVYAQLPSGIGEPPKRLVGWQKVQLAAGQSTKVSVTVPPQQLAIWNINKHQWKVPAGSYTFYAGGSSRDANAVSSGSTIAGQVIARKL
ncbi:beta-glucosidase family protein [Andreprevotia chitinilytica]|uniref:beta-glucosidase family protein n=1 Tax=Andreprevotia chitinilytica TaxID=396808 RepID=UPI0005507D8B|nr:glycoside hydrolase family 3 C-terminal domain-containing protein [Andreprevotia chitinilytica]